MVAQMVVAMVASMESSAAVDSDASSVEYLENERVH
jgi:hypothetical protein